jgi:hypothetical protein
LPKSEIRKELLEFDYGIVDKACIDDQPAEKTVKYTEQVGANSTILRSENVQVSMRVPKSIVQLITHSANSNGLLGSQNDTNSSLGLLDEKLLHQKEIEELYGEIMKTINEDQLFTENGIIFLIVLTGFL